MPYSYEATFEYRPEDGGWLATIPAFEGAVAFGHTVEEACGNAATVLRLFVAQYLDDGRELPEPAFHEPPCSVVTVDIDDAYRVKTRCMTISDAAAALGISTGRASQLATAGVLDAVKLDGRRYVTIASVNERSANIRGAGRPKREPAMA